jgi:hypothetical protein
MEGPLLDCKQWKSAKAVVGESGAGAKTDFEKPGLWQQALPPAGAAAARGIDAAVVAAFPAYAYKPLAAPPAAAAADLETGAAGWAQQKCALACLSSMHSGAASALPACT